MKGKNTNITIISWKLWKLSL